MRRERASKFIERVQKLVDEHGDLLIEVYTLGHGPFVPDVVVERSDRDDKKAIQIHPAGR